LKIKLLSFAVLSASLLSTVHAKAATIDLFTITSNSDTYSFSLAASPTPTFTGDGCIEAAGSGKDFCVDPTSVTVNSSVHKHYSVEFFVFDAAGGLEIFNSSDHSVFNVTGSQVFSGMVSAPTFTLGTYTLRLSGTGDCDGECETQPAKLVISEVSPGTTSPVPEPSSLVMMSSGLLAAAGAVRRRFKA
jgi:hypothetical protein